MSNTVPEGWGYTTVQDTCEVLDSKRIPLNAQERALRQGYYPYYGANGVQGYIDDFIFDGEHLLLAEDGGYFDEWDSRPISYLVSGKFWVNNHAHILKANEENSTRFIHYSLVHKNILKHINGGTRAKLNQSDMREIGLLIPPLPEQQKIAAILSSVDDVIEMTQAQIDKLKDLKTGMMQELLTKGIGHIEFKELPKWSTGKIAEITEIPAKWDLVNILSVAKLESGHTPSRDKPDYWGGEFQWVSLHDTKRLDTAVVHETELTVTQEGLDNSSARLLPAGTVAFSRTASVGHCVIFGREMATSQDFANYVCGKELHNRYLLHLFRWMQHVWSSLAEGSTHKTIYMPIFKKLQILLPPIDEQRKIAEVADSIDEKIISVREKLASVTNMKKALMQDLLTGTIRVKVD